MPYVLPDVIEDERVRTLVTEERIFLTPEAAQNLIHLFPGLVRMGAYRGGWYFYRSGGPPEERADFLRNMWDRGGVVALSVGRVGANFLNFIDVQSLVENPDVMPRGWGRVQDTELVSLFAQEGIGFAQDSPCDMCGETGLCVTRHNGQWSRITCLDCIKSRPFAYCDHCNVSWVMNTYFRSTYRCPTHEMRCVHCATIFEPDPLNDNYAFLSPDYAEHNGQYYCGQCAGDLFDFCTDCEGRFPTDDMLWVGEGEGENGDWHDEMQLCNYCHGVWERRNRENRRVRHGTRSTCAVDLAPETSKPFGVEIEVMFPPESTPMLGDYHSGYEAAPPFFSKWRAERDSSVYDGGEIISPVLQGAAGLAEVLATFDLLDEMEGSVNSRCGQHIHVETDTEGIRIQAIAGFMEDFLFASTGSYRRWHTDYATRIKQYSHDLDGVMRQLEENPVNTLSMYTDRSVVSRTGHGTFEWRYPAGTLNGTQFAINQAVTNFLTEYAEQADEKELKEFLKITRDLAVNDNNRRQTTGTAWGGAWVHDSIKEAAIFLNDKADWKPGGEWKGMAIELRPRANTSVVVRDDTRNLTREVDIPSERDVLRRLARQLNHFYRRAARAGQWWTETEGKSKVEEVLCLFS